MKILIGILMLCIIVIAHELGHMLIAKANHIEVNEFWVGFGPKLFGFEMGGTKYSFRLIPLGGACVFESDLPDDEKSEKKSEDAVLEGTDKGDLEAESVECEKEPEKVRKKDKHGRELLYLNEAPVLARIATLFAGPMFNFIMAFVMALFIAAFAYVPSAKIVDVADNSPAQAAGLMAGDDIVKINGSRVYLYPEVSLAIQTGVGKPLDLVYSRDGKKYRASLIPELNEEYGSYMIGVTFGSDDEALSSGFGKTVTGSLKYVRYMIKMTYLSFKMLVTGQASVKDMSGPVGVVSIVSSEYDAAAAISPLAVFLSMINVAVLISANLGVINLLPFPALDGGRLIFAFYELITGKKVDEKVEGFVHFIGSALLLILMVIVLYNDMIRLFGI